MAIQTVKPLPASAKVKILNEAGEDYEWYPSTDEILAAFAKDVYVQARRFSTSYRNNKNLFFNSTVYNSKTEKDEEHLTIGSMLDVGAGDGRVFDAIKTQGQNRHFSVKERFGIEKARAQSDDLIRKGVFIIGRDFFQTTLIDKEYSVIYSNPPYSIYEPWTVRLLREASFFVMYLVVPIRWADNQDIKRELKPYDHEVIGEYDFLHGDRAARARVNLIRVSRRTETYNGQEFAKAAQDPFIRWIEEYIGKFEELPKEKTSSYEDNRLWLEEKKGSPIERLVDDYDYEMKTLIEGFQAIAKLPPHVLKSIDLNKESIIAIIKQNFETIKKRYWRLAFDKLEAITQRLTKDTREKLVENMNQFQTLDFNADNIYSIVIWIIENFNRYTAEQIVEVFNAMTEMDYIKAYKSNTRWEKDTWRYTGKHSQGKPEKYILDYRFVTMARTGRYDYLKHSIVNDLAVVLRSLGAAISGDMPDPKSYQEKQTVCMDRDGEKEVAIECRFYANGNVHIKVNKELMMKLNVEVARILGWIRGPEDIEEEFEVSKAEAVKHWNTSSLVRLGKTDMRMLEYKQEVG